MSFIAGPFTATFGGTSTGIVERGFELEERFFAEEVRGDNRAQTVQDVIDQGKDVYISFVLEEFDQAITASLLNTWGAAAVGRTTQVGRIAAQQSLAKSLVLTSAAGTPQAGNWATATFGNCIIAPGFSNVTQLASTLQKLPIRLIALS